MEEKSLTLQQVAEIKEKALKLKSDRKLRVFPLVVFRDESCDEKDFYVVYMAEPTFPQFSKIYDRLQKG